MKHYWSNSKEKLVSAEEGKVGENLEPVPKNGACKKFMKLVQVILVVEIALFLGWVCYSIYQSKYVSSSIIEDDHLELNPVSALHNNFKLNSESPNESDSIKWQEKSSEHKALDLPSSSEPWSAKTQIVKNPDSSTERNSVLLNAENSFNHPGLSASLDTTSPADVEKSTSENYRGTKEDVEKKKIENVEENKMEKAEENKSPIQILTQPIATESFLKSGIEETFNVNEDFQKEADQKIEITTISAKPNNKETTENEEKEIKDKLEQEINSELSLIPISMTEVDSGVDENFSDIKELKQEVEEEFGKVIDEAQGNKDKLTVPKFIQILHDLDRAEAEAKKQISTGDIIPSSEGYFKKYHFQISLGPKTAIEENDQANQNSQVVSEESSNFPFFVHVFFNISDPEENSSESENAESIIDSVYPSIHPETNFSEIDPEFYTSSWKMEIPIPRDEESLEWWVNIPEFQDTREEGLSSEGESQTDLLNLFNKLNSHSIIVPGSEEVESKKSSDFVESKPESLNKAATDLVSSIFSSEQNDHNFSEKLDYSRKPKYPLIDVLEPYESPAEIVEHKLENIIKKLNSDIGEESVTRLAVNETEDHLDDQVLVDQQMNSMKPKDEVPEEVIPDEETATTEEVRKKNEDLMKRLIQFPNEDYKMTGTQTESHLHQEESMIVNEEMISEEEPERELVWKDEENWFHSQPTWKEESKPEKYLNDLFKNLEPQNYEYDEILNSDSTEYLYED